MINRHPGYLQGIALGIAGRSKQNRAVDQIAVIFGCAGKDGRTENWCVIDRIPGEAGGRIRCGCSVIHPVGQGHLTIEVFIRRDLPDPVTKVCRLTIIDRQSVNRQYVTIGI